MKKKHYPEYLNRGKPARKGELDADNPVEMAMRYFGKRLEVKGGGVWLLDKKPMSLDQVMQRYNAIRRRFRLPQVGKNPKWWV